MGRDDGIRASFLDLYIEYTKKQESPEMFHLWTAMTVLAAALGRKCYMDRGYYRLYPNLFTILVAGAATCRKSTAINIGVSIFRTLKDYRVVKGKITPERFIDELQPVQQGKPAQALVHSSELSVFLTKQNYGEPLIHVLTDLFDCPDEWEYKTRNRGEVILKDTFLCIIAGTTPDGIAQGIPVSALQEGFASRLLLVYQEDTNRRIPRPFLSDEEREMEAQLKIILQDRASLVGEFKLNSEAEQWYDHWYMNMKPPSDKRLEGMFARKHDHLLRFAMVLAGSERSMVIDTSHLEAADMLMDFLEKCAPGALREIGGDDKTPLLSRMRTYLRREKRIPHSTLLRMMYPCRADVFRQLIETLIESGEVVRDPEKPQIYVWVEQFQPSKE